MQLCRRQCDEGNRKGKNPGDRDRILMVTAFRNDLDTAAAIPALQRGARTACPAGGAAIAGAIATGIARGATTTADKARRADTTFAQPHTGQHRTKYLYGKEEKRQYVRQVTPGHCREYTPNFP